MKRKRPTERVSDRGSSRCVIGCEAVWTSANHQACAARHHDATGHLVEVHVDRVVRYGSAEADPAQTEIEVSS